MRECISIFEDDIKLRNRKKYFNVRIPRKRSDGGCAFPYTEQSGRAKEEGRMQKKRYFLIGFLCFFLAGCHAVVVPQPFGVEKVQLSPAEIEGVWFAEEENPLTVKVVDQEKAIVSVTYEESRESIRTVTVHLMAGEKWQYASLLNSDEGDPSKGYIFVCVKITPKRILVWMPDHKRFKELVEKGTIKGRVENGDVYLDEVPPELIAWVESEKFGLLFDWQDPLVFYKKIGIIDQGI